MVELAARMAQILVAIGIAYFAAFWFVLVIWTFRDIETRSRNVVTQIFATLLVVLFFVPGVLLYLILRPKQTLDEAFQRSLEEEYLLQDLEELPLCPRCFRYAGDDFLLCPHCQTRLREPCAKCARLVDLQWPICPYCTAVQHDHAPLTDHIEPLEARWTAPAIRRRRPADQSLPPRRVVTGRVANDLVDTMTGSPSTNGHQPHEQVETPDSPPSEAGGRWSGLRTLLRPIYGRRKNGVRVKATEPFTSNGSVDGHPTNGVGSADLYDPYPEMDTNERTRAQPTRTSRFATPADFRNGDQTAETRGSRLEEDS